MRRRLFAAINLDNAAIGEIEKIKEGAREIIGPEVVRRARFVAPRNWHLTVSFLGYQDEEGLVQTAKSLRSAASKFKPMKISFDRLEYGPPDGNSSRMIWIGVSGETSDNISSIKTFLEDELEKNGVRFRREKRAFSGHITLARFASEIRKAALAPIGKRLHFASAAGSLDLMESELKRSGAEYSILQKFPFSGENGKI